MIFVHLAIVAMNQANGHQAGASPPHLSASRSALISKTIKVEMVE
jgi:hypothetical protein